MTEVTLDYPGAKRESDIPIVPHAGEIAADRNFRLLLTGCGVLVFGLLASIGAFLFWKGWLALRTEGMYFFTTAVWNSSTGKFGVLTLLVGSVAVAVVAVVIAFPISVGTALVINEYAPMRMRPWLTSLVDLLATVPSIVYGFWGIVFVSNLQIGPARWLAHYFGFVPFLRTPSAGYFGKSVFATGLICALTIVPIITSVSREVMAQAPREVCEAALGLGGTRWGMITDVVLPFSRNGIVGAGLLGLGRGLGETMIPLLVLSAALTGKVTSAILGPNGSGTIAQWIAGFFPESGKLEQSALILSALMLFVVTLLINRVARAIVLHSEKAAR